jgi:DNA polymerase IV
MACRLIGRERHLLNAKLLAQSIKCALSDVGATLRCSIGLAPNRYLSKVAADMQKPDGLTVLLLDQLPMALYPLKLSDLVGVGDRMEARLLKCGIQTVEQLCALSPEQMRTVWNSVLGERIWYWLRGEDFHDPEFKRKSIGKQHVLAPEYRTRESACGVAQKLLHTAATNMRKLKMWAGGIGVAVHFMKKRPASSYGPLIDIPSWEAHKRIHECQDTFTLQSHLSQLWRRCPPENPLQVGVWLYHLVTDEQRSLFLFEDSTEKLLRTSTAMDRINLKFGKQAVYLGGTHNARKSAPTRISYMSIPDLNEF